MPILDRTILEMLQTAIDMRVLRLETPMTENDTIGLRGEIKALRFVVAEIGDMQRKENG